MLTVALLACLRLVSPAAAHHWRHLLNSVWWTAGMLPDAIGDAGHAALRRRRAHRGVLTPASVPLPRRGVFAGRRRWHCLGERGARRVRAAATAVLWPSLPPCRVARTLPFCCSPALGFCLPTAGHSTLLAEQLPRVGDIFRVRPGCSGWANWKASDRRRDVCSA